MQTLIYTWIISEYKYLATIDENYNRDILLILVSKSYLFFGICASDYIVHIIPIITQRVSSNGEGKRYQIFVRIIKQTSR